MRSGSERRRMRSGSEERRMRSGSKEKNWRKRSRNEKEKLKWGMKEWWKLKEEK